jgi:hypothetical protein
MQKKKHVLAVFTDCSGCEYPAFFPSVRAEELCALLSLEKLKAMDEEQQNLRDTRGN